MASSGLIKNTDFSAELLLNKVMNGQYRASNENTITVAGRINAAHLDSAANKLNVEAENVRKAQVMADGAANTMSEILERVRDFSDLNATLTGDDLKSAAADVKAQLESLIALKVEDKAVLGGVQNVKLGQGDATGLDIGLDLANETGYKAFKEALDTTAGDGTAVGETVIKTAINELMVNITNEAGKAAVLENRYTSMNDLVSSYHQASDDQVVTQGGNSTSLLNRLLG